MEKASRERLPLHPKCEFLPPAPPSDKLSGRCPDPSLQRRGTPSKITSHIKRAGTKRKVKQKNTKSPKVSFCMISVNVQLVVCVPRIRETQFVMPLAWCSAPQEHGLRGATGSGVGKGEGGKNVDGCNRRLSKVANSP